MDTIAARFARLECAVEEPSAIHRSAVTAPKLGLFAAAGGVAALGGAPAAPCDASMHSAALAQWVRLFEKELVVLRNETKACSNAVGKVEARMKAVEEEAATPGDLQELAELLLQKQHSEVGGVVVAAAGLADIGGGAGVRGSSGRGLDIYASSFAGRRQEFRRQAAERLVHLEALSSDVASRLQVVERELFLVAAAQPGGDRGAEGGAPELHGVGGGVGAFCGGGRACASETALALAAEASAPPPPPGQFAGSGPPPSAGGASAPSEASRRVERAPQRGDGTLAARVRQLEEDVQVALEPLRRHAVSLRALEATSAKVEALTKQLAALPAGASAAVGASATLGGRGVAGSGGGGRGGVGEPSAAAPGGGALSLADAYRMQLMVEQAMIAVEALARQRSDDVKMVNSYLGEVYARIERDVDRDYGVAHAAPFLDLLAQFVNLQSKFENLSTVAMPEIEHRALHESRLARESVALVGRQLPEMMDQVRKVSERVAELGVRVDSAVATAEARSSLATRTEALALEVQRDLAAVRMEVTALTSAGAGGAAFEHEARMSAYQAHLEAQLERHAREMSRHADVLAREIAVIRERNDDLQASAGSIVAWRAELTTITSDLAELRGSTLRAEIKTRERLAQGEREMRAEIRAAQGLVLEVAEQLRASGHRAATTGGWNEIAGRFNVEGGGVPQLGDLFDFGGAPSPAAKGGTRAGSLSILGDGVLEWRIPGIRALVRTGDRGMLVSAPFTVPSSQLGATFDHLHLQLQFFPLGSRRKSSEGFCSLYVSGPEGLHLQFLLSLGSVEQGPMECYFDRPNKVTGKHDFCHVEDELEADGSAVVRFTVLQVDVAEVARATHRPTPSRPALQDASPSTVRF